MNLCLFLDRSTIQNNLDVCGGGRKWKRELSLLVCYQYECCHNRSTDPLLVGLVGLVVVGAVRFSSDSRSERVLLQVIVVVD